MKIINKILSRLKIYSNLLNNKSIVAFYNLLYRPYSKFRFKSILADNKPDPQYLTKFSDSTRNIEISESDMELEEVVITCYFTKRIDPQSGILRSVPDIDYIRPWYDSIRKLNINGIIIHDGIDEAFIKQYQTQKIQFRKYTAGKYAIFDERWILYYMFVLQTNIKLAFFTDISDVFITADPFATCNKNYTLYIGRDNANKIRHSGWMLSEIERFVNNSTYKIPSSFIFQQLYNVGIVGGSRNIMLFFLSKVIDLILLTDSEPYKEMTVLNLIVHKYFFPKLYFSPDEQVLTDPKNDNISAHENLISGYPFNSEFKKYDNNSSALFIHK